MSFQEQERAMFDLLFDRALRDDFCARADAALADYQLSEDERRDFLAIRPDALRVDARMRVFMILIPLCKVLPMSFSLATSMHDGPDRLRSLVDRQTMHTPPVKRAVSFGERLRAWLASSTFSNVMERTKALGIVDAEINMARTSADLKQRILANRSPSDSLPEIHADWQVHPIRLAPFTSAAVLPQSYDTLKPKLCPCPDDRLWSHLSRNPLSADTRLQVLAEHDPVLHLARARLEHASRCNPTVSHETAELSEGFASLFQYVTGQHSTRQIIEGLSQAGAPQELGEGVKSGFLQLVQMRMLEVA